MCFIVQKVFLLSCFVMIVIHLAAANPFKFPGQQSTEEQQGRNIQTVPLGQSEGRFLNINNVPNGLFNRLTASNYIQDDIADYDENVGGQQQSSGVTAPTLSIQDTQDRRRHRHRQRKRPCVPYSYRNNGDNGRTFVSLHWNDYNYYDGQGGQQSGQGLYDPVGGYPCYSLGGIQKPERPQRPHRPNRPLYPGTSPLSDDAGTGNRPGGALGFFGPGGLFDINMILTNWLRPQNGASTVGGLSDTGAPGAGAANDVKPLFEVNVQDAVQNVVSSAGGFLGAFQGLVSQTPPLQTPLADPTPEAPAVQSDPPQDSLIQPRPSKKPHKHRPLLDLRPQHHHHHYDVNELTEIQVDLSKGARPLRRTRGPYSRSSTSHTSQQYPWWSFYGLFDNNASSSVT